jgi:hypothetical protein
VRSEAPHSGPRRTSSSRDTESARTGTATTAGDAGELDAEFASTRIANNAGTGIQTERDDDNGDQGPLLLGGGVTFKRNDEDLDLDDLELSD